MKSIRLIIFLIGISFLSASAQAPKLVYGKYTWFEGLAKAKAEGKFFLMYISQTNCEYCKELDKTTMTDKNLILFLNQKFVLARHKVSTTYGGAIALDYHLTTTPALMVQNPNLEGEPLILYGVKDAATLQKELEDYIKSEKK